VVGVVMDNKGKRILLLIFISIWVFVMAVIELIRFCISIPWTFIKNLIIVRKPIKGEIK